ncbi:hypothetical protein [Tessaracoccus antarcticus]|uniref:Uncharacterized protein n=1 Tax=Tessaracoccus antarcticus TaxID=2479848 RepID=A0A3M0G4U5_9ACTN|nr:hypothetical protein [Tessaracoccus antarcticus]RMB57262.1 hypothetical protein EAX62_16125 [Tessaracoccus antarcticus]
MTTRFWTAIADQLATIRTNRPTTVAEIIETLGGSAAASAGDAFFAGSGGDDQLWDALEEAGWRIHPIEGAYYYTATHPATGQSLTYIEGDVYDNTK